MNFKRIEFLLEKQDEETITDDEIKELQNILKECTVLNEFDMAMIAFQRGYKDVYYDEFERNKDKIAAPHKWIIDSTVVSDFYSVSKGIIRVITGQGDFFYFTQEALREYKQEIEAAHSLSEDDLLTAYRLNSNIN